MLITIIKLTKTLLINVDVIRNYKIVKNVSIQDFTILIVTI